MAQGVSDFFSGVKAEKVLIEAFIEVVEDGVGRSQFKDESGDEN